VNTHFSEELVDFFRAEVLSLS